jgi:hypothetical protein
MQCLNKDPSDNPPRPRYQASLRGVRPLPRLELINVRKIECNQRINLFIPYRYIDLKLMSQSTRRLRLLHLVKSGSVRKASLYSLSVYRPPRGHQICECPAMQVDLQGPLVFGKIPRYCLFREILRLSEIPSNIPCCISAQLSRFVYRSRLEDSLTGFRIWLRIARKLTVRKVKAVRIRLDLL